MWRKLHVLVTQTTWKAVNITRKYANFIIIIIIINQQKQKIIGKGYRT